MKNKKIFIVLLSVIAIGLIFITLIVNFSTTYNYTINECLEKFEEQGSSKEVAERLCQCIMEEKNKYTLKAGVEELCINFLPSLFSDEEFIEKTNQTTESQKFLEKYPSATIFVDRNGPSLEYLDYAVEVDYRIDKYNPDKDINYLRLRIFINPRDNQPADRFIDCSGTYIKENLIEYIEKEQCFK